MSTQDADHVAAIEGATVKKLGYSAHPWRIVTEDGREVTRSVVFDHPNLGKMVLQEAGYRIKRDAVAALNELQARSAARSSQPPCGSDQQPQQSPGASPLPTASDESTRPASGSLPGPSSPRPSTAHRCSPVGGAELLPVGGGVAALPHLGGVVGEGRVSDSGFAGGVRCDHGHSKPWFQGRVNQVSTEISDAERLGRECWLCPRPLGDPMKAKVFMVRRAWDTFAALVHAECHPANSSGEDAYDNYVSERYESNAHIDGEDNA